MSKKKFNLNKNVLLGCVVLFGQYAFGDATIYGKISLSTDYISQSLGNNLTRVSSNTSRIGFKGDEILDEQLKLIWQIESGINVDDGSNSSFATRNSFIGLTSNGATIKLGKHDTPYKLLGYKMPQILGGSVGDITGFSGIFHRIDQRPSNAILTQYSTGKIDIGYMYATKEETTNNAVINSAGINYADQNYGYELGWQQNKNTKYDYSSLPTNTVNAKLAGGFIKCKKAQLSLAVEEINDSYHQLNKMTMLTTELTSNSKFDIIYATSNQESINGTGSAYEIVLAGEYSLSKRTAIIAGTGIIQNSNTNINFGANWLPLTMPKDNDLKFYTLGIKHSF